VTSQTSHAADKPVWYELATDLPLMQGDFIPNITYYIQNAPVLPAGATQPEASVDVEQFDQAIIISQSCDLDPSQADNTHVLLCPVYTISALIEQNDEQVVGSLWGQAVKGQAIHWHPLSRCDLDTHTREASMVDFRRLFELPIETVARLAKEAKPWLRLRSPYREQMSQAFARRIMRVATVDDLPKWKDVK
jgi:hypothetical protein